MLLEAKDSFFRELQIEHVNQEAIVKYFRKKLQEMAEGIVIKFGTHLIYCSL